MFLQLWRRVAHLLLLVWLLSSESAAAQFPVAARHWDADPDSLRKVLAGQHADTTRLRTLQHLLDVEPRAPEVAEAAALSARLRRPEQQAYRLLAAGTLLLKTHTAPALDSMMAAINEFDRLQRPVPVLLATIRYLFNPTTQQQAKKTYYEGKLAQYRRRGDAASSAACYHGLAGYYNSRGDHNQAIGYYLQAAALYRDFYWNLYYDCLTAAGLQYADWGNLDKALYYLRLSLAGQGSQKGQRPKSVGYRNRSLAQVQLQLHQYPAALRAVDQSLALPGLDTLTRQSEQAYGWLIKSAVLLAQGRSSEAEPLLQAAQRVANAFHLPFRSPAGDFELDATWARYYAARHDDARTEAHWLAAYRTAQENHIKPLQLAYLRELARFYRQHGHAAAAAAYAWTALSLADTLSAAQGRLHVAQYEILRADRAQRARIAGLRESQRQDATRARRQRWVLGAVLAVLALIGGFSFLLWRSNLLTRRANALLQRQKAEIQVQRDQTNRAMKHLRATQAQLIQKEKMASLGELTAGIAHEIQNPLNFVNNFAQVSTELVTELKEAHATGDAGSVTALADDLYQNLGKITEHGQRAAGIVCGMLEHSRASTGERRPTDLNRLCDEYLRLAYQGLRAKDKSFNAALHTDFAPGLPLVNVVTGDLGRVLLNLLTNAFYAVRERQRTGESGYQPQVGVRTLLVNGQVQIQVTDNGMGMSQEVQAKIFQPFFTTKPPGEGTGLGLSLSHDIITQGHGGTLAVESRQGEGSTFSVFLPLNGPN